MRVVLGGIGLASFFLAENIVENAVSEDYGTFGGLGAALLVIGFQNRLMLIVRSFVNSVFSDEMGQQFSEQMTTYMHLYRTAILDHIITEEEQTMLTVTAKGLNLNSTEIEAVEDFVKLEKGNRQVWRRTASRQLLAFLREPGYYFRKNFFTFCCRLEAVMYL